MPTGFCCLLFFVLHALAGVEASNAAGNPLARPTAFASAPALRDTTRIVALLKRANQIVATNPDSASLCSQQALALARQIRHLRKEVQALELIGWLQFARGDYPGGLRIYQQALTIAQARGFAKESAILHADIGRVLQEQGAYPEALENNLAALRYYGAVHDSMHLAYAILSVASVEYHEHNYVQAIAYYQQAISILKKHKSQNDLDTSYLGLAMVYADQGHFDQAETYFRLGLTIFRRKKDSTNESIVLNNLGDIYSKQKNYALARSYFTQALQIASVNNDESIIAGCCVGLAQVCYQQGAYAQAQGYARRSLALAGRIKAQPVAQEACLVLSNVLAAQRKFEPALAFYKQGKALEDSIYGSKHAAQMQALRNQYQHYRREQEEAAHRYRIRQLERDQRISRLTLLLLVGIALGLLLLGWLGWRQYRATRQRNLAQQQAQQATERAEHFMRQSKLQQAEYEIGLKDKKLATLALSIMQKGEFLHEVKERLEVIARTAEEDVRKQLTRLRQNIEQNGPANKEWEQFRLIFEEVHQDFFSELQRRYPEVTPNELKLAALLKLNFSSKAMAGLLGISEESVKKARYRLRQKLQLSTADNLVDFMMRLDARVAGTPANPKGRFLE